MEKYLAIHRKDIFVPVEHEGLRVYTEANSAKEALEEVIDFGRRFGLEIKFRNYGVRSLVSGHIESTEYFRV